MFVLFVFEFKSKQLFTRECVCVCELHVDIVLLCPSFFFHSLCPTSW